MQSQQINITLGTAGHIDHGKTALTRMLTGCETDHLKEEKRRGMSIELGFAPCAVAGIEVGIVDVPGHENFIRTMVAGASGIDAVILVVAADDGVMPQTREHLDIMTLLDVRGGIVAITKIDRVEAERVEEVRGEIRLLTAGTFLEGAPALAVSSVTGDGFGEFREALSTLVGSVEPRRTDGVFRQPVERAFSARGYGTVVTGIPVSGSLRTGDEIVLLPQGLEGRVSSVQVYGRDSDVAKSGQCAALNVRHWDHKTIRQGNTVTLPGYFSPREWFVCSVRLLDRPGLFLKTGTSVRLHTGTSEVIATVYLLDGSEMRAGEVCPAQVRMQEPLVAGPGDRFILRGLSPVQTVGGGEVIEGMQRRLRRSRPSVVEDIRERARAVRSDRDFVNYCIRNAPDHAATERDLSVRTKTLPHRLTEILRELIDEGSVVEPAGRLYMHTQTAASLGEELLRALGDFHRGSPESPGMPLREVRVIKSLDMDKAVLEVVVGLLKGQGKVVEKNQRLALAEHREQFTEEERRHMDAVEAVLRGRPFNPPGVGEIAENTGADAETTRRTLRILTEQGRAVSVAKDILFHAEAVDRANEILVEFIREEGRLESVKFKYLLETTRKFAIPLLDYFDKIGVTRRVGNTRFLKTNPHDRRP